MLYGACCHLVMSHIVRVSAIKQHGVVCGCFELASVKVVIAGVAILFVYWFLVQSIHSRY